MTGYYVNCSQFFESIFGSDNNGDCLEFAINGTQGWKTTDKTRQNVFQIKIPLLIFL